MANVNMKFLVDTKKIVQGNIWARLEFVHVSLVTALKMDEINLKAVVCLVRIIFDSCHIPLGCGGCFGILSEMLISVYKIHLSSCTSVTDFEKLTRIRSF